MGPTYQSSPSPSRSPRRTRVRLTETIPGESRRFPFVPCPLLQEILAYKYPRPCRPFPSFASRIPSRNQSRFEIKIPPPPLLELGSSASPSIGARKSRDENTRTTGVTSRSRRRLRPERGSTGTQPPSATEPPVRSSSSGHLRRLQQPLFFALVVFLLCASF